MQIQTILNSDIVMQFDECTLTGKVKGLRPHHQRKEARVSMELSLRWAKRCITEFERLQNPNALFGIVQGGMFENLREESLAALVDMNLPGYAVGGVSVGEPKDEMLRVMNHIVHKLPENKPRYLMGVGTPEDLVDGVAAGVDMFDCVMPTRNAATATCSPALATCACAMPRTRPTSARLTRPVRATPARPSAVLTCTTWTAAVKCSAPC